ncbi:MAG: tetratricopeptide repeat protein, partial [Mariprofundaceae bacterium]
KADRAEKLFRDFLARHPDALGVLNALGRLLSGQNRLAEAVLVYRDMAARTGNDPDVLQALGLLHYQRKDYQQAARVFREILKTRDDPSARYYLAASLEAQEKPAQAERLYATIPPEAGDLFANAQLRLAIIESTSNRLASAARRLQKLLKKHPRHAAAWVLLSGVWLEQKHYALLLKETEPALALPKPPPRLLINRAIAHDHLKQYDALETELRQLLEHDPRNAEALNFLGYSLADRGVRLDEAERLIRRALTIKPDDGYYLDSLAWALHKQGRSREAIPIQRKALAKVPDDPVMLDHLGDMLWQAGEKAAARETWRKALAHKPPKPAMIRRKIRRGLP